MGHGGTPQTTLIGENKSLPARLGIWFPVVFLIFSVHLWDIAVVF